MKTTAACLAVVLAVLVGACGGTPEEAQARPDAAGLSPGSRALADEVARALKDELSTSRIRHALKTCTARPHPAGSRANLELAKTLEAELKAAGLETRLESYEVLLPRPAGTTVELLEPVAWRAPLMEEPLEKDYDTYSGRAQPAFLAYTPDGNVVGRVVFVNRASPGDFARLTEAGTDLEGAVGLARTGGPAPGAKLRHAAGAGLSALMLYTDPADTGYARGDPYPQGPWLPASGMRRDTALLLSRRPGDPLTPGVPALSGAARLELRDTDVLPPIPGAVLAARDARPILEHLSGARVPEGWQGGLPFAYHLGGTGKVVVRLRTRASWGVRRIHNLVATLRGSAFPDELVVCGCPRDAWVFGASSSASGTAVMMEAARMLGSLARRGLRPSRSVVFAFFDGGRPGALGAVEHVETHAEAVTGRTALYLDLDTAVTGGTLAVRGDPCLAPFLNGTWASLEAAGSTATESAPWDGSRAGPARGSGPLPFGNHHGIPVLQLAFEGPCGVQHALYDTFGWIKRFGDPELVRHGDLAVRTAALLWRAGTFTLLPYDLEAEARWVSRHANALAAAHPASDLRPLLTATRDMSRAGNRLAAACRRLLAAGPDPLALRPFNAALRNLHRILHTTDTASFHRSRLLGPDPRTGRNTLPLPRLTHALRTDDDELFKTALQDLTTALTRAAETATALTTRLDDLRP